MFTSLQMLTLKRSELRIVNVLVSQHVFITFRKKEIFNVGNFCLYFQTAKAQFSKNQDPIDCALFYLAMKKKNVICGLYRLVVMCQ